MQRVATRARLVEVARELFAKYGYHDVAITEIARAAGVTHGVIHAHFHCKAGLLFAILSENNDTQAAARSVAESSGPVRDRLRKVLEIWAVGDLHDRELLKVMEAFSWEWPYEFEQQNRDQLERALQPLRTLIEQAVASGELAATLDVGRVVTTALAIYTQTLREAVFDEDTVEECVDEVMARWTLLIDGLRP